MTSAWSDNLGNIRRDYQELEELLLSGGSALPTPSAKASTIGKYERTFFIQISSITAKWCYSHMAEDALRTVGWWLLRIGKKESGSRVPALRAAAENVMAHALDDWLQAEAELTERRSLCAAA